MIREFLYSELQQVFENTLKAFPAAALTDGAGESVSIKPYSASDLGTLSSAIQTTLRYFPLKSGEFILMNDPYSGGSILSTMTLMTGLRLSEKSNSPDFVLAARIPFKPKIHLADSVEAEGLRIPPTPIYHDGELNAPLLKVISEHPECPPRFEETLSKVILQMIDASQTLLADLKALHSGPIPLKEYFEHSRLQAAAFIEELAHGEAKEELILDDGSKVQLKVEVQDGVVLCDFTGSSAGKRYHLTDSASFGACAGAILAFLDAPIPYNKGTLSAFHIAAPAGSLVNCKYPSPVFLGMTDGADLIASLTLRVLNQIDRKHQVAQSGVSQCAFHLDFGSENYFYDFIQPGAAATRQSAGPSAIDLWKRTHLRASVEEVERRYPIRIKSVSIRQKSGGSGSFRGGDGMTKVIEILKTTELKWMVSEVFKKPEGHSGGKSGIGPEIFVLNAEDEKTELSEFGKQSLKPGEQIVVHSSGGGGFGEPPQST